MKKILSVVLCSLFAAVSVCAQDGYRHLVEKGKKWTYHHDAYPHVYDYYYTLEGDTVVAGNSCLKMVSENKANDGGIVYEGALFEKNKKVYCFRPENDEPELLYDFDCEVGDTVRSMIVLNITNDTILYAPRVFTFKPLILSESGEGMHVFAGSLCWIEGVGATTDFFDMLPITGNYNSLIACEVNGVEICKFITGITAVNRRPVQDRAVFDLQGRRLKSPSRGINIIRDSNGTTRKVFLR